MRGHDLGETLRSVGADRRLVLDERCITCFPSAGCPGFRRRDTALIDPGKPWQNAIDESFNGKLRDECLSLQWFRNRMDAKLGVKQRRRHYNEVRPHSSRDYLTPAEFKAAC